MTLPQKKEGKNFTAAFSLVVKKIANYLDQSSEGKCKMWFGHAVEYYTVMKRKALLCSRAWMSIGHMTLREELYREAACCVSAHTGGSRRGDTRP